MSHGNLRIGELARRANVPTSMLRFYERAGLLSPVRRSGGGYRLYAPEAEQTLLFIRRAQRLGFSLEDIKLFLRDRGRRELGGGTVLGIAEKRFVEIERRLTELLVLRHELELFLDDLARRLGREAGGAAARLYRELVSAVCRHAERAPRPSSLAKAFKRLGCALAGPEREQLVAALRGRHIHVWREPDGYSVLVPGTDREAAGALMRLAAAEAGCKVHVEPRVTQSDEGYLFSARGPNAFLFAQLFLALEAAEA